MSNIFIFILKQLNNILYMLKNHIKNVNIDSSLSFINLK